MILQGDQSNFSQPRCSWNLGFSKKSSTESTAMQPEVGPNSPEARRLVQPGEI